jgi:hypothetical protein
MNNDVKKKILIILEIPKSGISEMALCLKTVGVYVVSKPSKDLLIAPQEINALLLQDLSIDQYSANDLPQDWLEGLAAAKASQRVKALVLDLVEKGGLWALADPVICRVWPLWARILKQYEITPAVIFVLDHPLHTAAGLEQKQGSDADYRHLIWLRYSLEALEICRQMPHFITTARNLNEDPLTTLKLAGTELGISYPRSPNSVRARLLTMLQPYSEPSAVEYSEKSGINEFAALLQLYEQASNRGVEIGPFLEDIKRHLESQKKIPIAKRTGVQEWGGFSQEHADFHPEAGTIEKKLFMEITLPDLEGWRYSFQALHRQTIVPERWQKITVSVTCPEILQNGRIRILPLNTAGSVWISSIRFFNAATGRILWQAVSFDDFAGLTFEGPCVQLPCENGLALAVAGSKAGICLPLMADFPDCPVKMEMWQKVEQGTDSFLYLLKGVDVGSGRIPLDTGMLDGAETSSFVSPGVSRIAVHKVMEVYQEAIEIIDIHDVARLESMEPECIVVIMPCIDTVKGMETARVLARRAGTDCKVLIVYDTLRQGFIKTLNDTAQRLDTKYIVYLAQDAYPGRGWLRCAQDSLDKTGKSMLAFNDGKWRGRIASFGMVRTEWSRRLYGGPVFYPGYVSHGADPELTVIARAQDNLVYNPECTLLEYDPDKDFGGSNPRDRRLFSTRFVQGFDGLAPIEKLKQMAGEYGVRWVEQTDFPREE